MKNMNLALVLVSGLAVGGAAWGADEAAVPPAAAPAIPATPTAAVASAPATPETPAPPVEAAATVPVPAVPKPEPFRAATVWSGAVVEVKLTSEAQKWRDMDVLLKENRFKPDEGLDKPAIDRSPADGKQYAILTMKMREKRSLGKYDYLLRVNGTDCPCLALGSESNPFDPRVWEIRHAPGVEEVLLVFEVPTGATDGMLVSALPLTVSQPDTSIRLALPPPPPVEVPAPDPAAPAAAAPAADVTPAAAVPATATPTTPAPPAVPAAPAVP